MKEWELKETPRQRIQRFNRQLEHWRCYGYTRTCTQPICTFCQHFKVWEGYEGDTDADCLVGAPKFLGGDEVYHCRQFKADKNWRYIVEQILSEALDEELAVLKDLLEAQHAKDQEDCQKLVAQAENPYKSMTAREAGRTPEAMCELEVGFEDCRQAILEALKAGKADE